jgi:hypothetical protein
MTSLVRRATTRYGSIFRMSRYRTISRRLAIDMLCVVLVPTLSHHLFVPDCPLSISLTIVHCSHLHTYASQRTSYGEERYEQRDFQAVVRQRFLELRDVDTRLASGGPPWHMIEAAQSMDDVEAAIWAVVEPLLATVGPTPVGKLWMDEAAAGAAGAAGGAVNRGDRINDKRLG